MVDTLVNYINLRDQVGAASLVNIASPAVNASDIVKEVAFSVISDAEVTVVLEKSGVALNTWVTPPQTLLSKTLEGTQIVESTESLDLNFSVSGGFDGFIIKNVGTSTTCNTLSYGPYLTSTPTPTSSDIDTNATLATTVETALPSEIYDSTRCVYKGVARLAILGTAEVRIYDTTTFSLVETVSLVIDGYRSIISDDSYIYAIGISTESHFRRVNLTTGVVDSVSLASGTYSSRGHAAAGMAAVHGNYIYTQSGSDSFTRLYRIDLTTLVVDTPVYTVPGSPTSTNGHSGYVQVTTTDTPPRNLVVWGLNTYYITLDLSTGVVLDTNASGIPGATHLGNSAVEIAPGVVFFRARSGTSDLVVDCNTGTGNIPTYTSTAISKFPMLAHREVIYKIQDQDTAADITYSIAAAGVHSEETV